VSADREPTAPEVLEWRRDDVFLPETDGNTEEFPSLRNISAGFIFSGVVRPLERAPPGYVTLTMRPASSREFDALAQWNMLWEAGQFRRRFCDLDDLPEPMAKIADLGDVNVSSSPEDQLQADALLKLGDLLFTRYRGNPRGCQRICDQKPS
jgi:hypothetical protein